VPPGGANKKARYDMSMGSKPAKAPVAMPPKATQKKNAPAGKPPPLLGQPTVKLNEHVGKRVKRLWEGQWHECAITGACALPGKGTPHTSKSGFRRHSLTLHLVLWVTRRHHTFGCLQRFAHWLERCVYDDGWCVTREWRTRRLQHTDERALFRVQLRPGGKGGVGLDVTAPAGTRQPYPVDGRG